MLEFIGYKSYKNALIKVAVLSYKYGTMTE